MAYSPASTVSVGPSPDKSSTSRFQRTRGEPGNATNARHLRPFRQQILHIPRKTVRWACALQRCVNRQTLSLRGWGLIVLWADGTLLQVSQPKAILIFTVLLLAISSSRYVINTRACENPTVTQLRAPFHHTNSSRTAVRASSQVDSQAATATRHAEMGFGKSRT